MSTHRIALIATLLLLLLPIAKAQTNYQYPETRELVGLVNDAADLVHARGEAAFAEFRVPNARWRRAESYIFVLDPTGNMLVHSDPSMEGKNQIDLKDINGKPIIRGLLSAVTNDKPQGWYHYEWPVPGGLLPRWKSSYVKLVTAPSGKSYVVGSGMYNDRMEREFVVDLVKNAVAALEKDGKAAFKLFHDPTSPFLVKDAYVFVITMDAIEIVNPAFPNLEGRNISDLKDTNGKFLTREMLQVVDTSGSGWVDYMWPKPGESVSTEKSAYVSKAMLDGKPVTVGAGVYLADARTAPGKTRKMTAAELTTIVRDGASLLSKQGENAYPEFRKKGSKWFSDDLYFVVRSEDGIRTLNAANPTLEGLNMIDVKDILGRPYGRMLFDATSGPTGEGWVHYMFPEPGDIFPTWKSTFVKRVTFPSGKQYAVGAGIYNMQMDRQFIEDVVDRAAALIAAKGRDAFTQLRDRTGPFFFMDTYVFVDDPNGVELVNPAQPSLEGKNLIDVKDLNGKLLVREYIDAAKKKGSAWVDYHWYRPGQNEPALKRTYVRKVQYAGETFIVGSGFYVNGDEK
ncbi:MAG TPA: cache domain-containing protein [Pyrinomonadaceae bacterium]